MHETVRLGVLNMMPNAFAYEQTLSQAIGVVPDYLHTRYIRLSTHSYESSVGIKESYADMSTIVADGGLDLLIITGAPVEDRPFEKVHYWKELIEIIRYADTHSCSILGICFGGLALARYLGAEKNVIREKIFGDFQLGINPSVPADMQALCPQRMYFSTWATLKVTEAFDSQACNVASHHRTGCAVAISRDRRFTMVMGHPEYHVSTLEQEWSRDRVQGIAYTRDFDGADFERMRRDCSSESRSFVSRWVQSRTEAIVTSRRNEGAPC